MSIGCEDRTSMRSVLSSPSDPSPRQIIGRQLHRYLVSGQDLDVILAELARYMGKNDVSVLKLDLKVSIRQSLCNYSLYLDNIFF